MPFASGKLPIFSLVCVFSFTVAGCSANASQRTPLKTAEPQGRQSSTIEIKAGSPAETVKAFYEHLRKGRIREAIYLTNLRPAIEGLTETELTEFRDDFAAIARIVPAEVEINGEIISGNSATVTAKLPAAAAEESDFHQIRLRRDGKYWVILTVDEAAEAVVRKEGNKYFHALRIASKEADAREMLERVAKAQMAYAVQNGRGYADIPALMAAGLLPADIATSESTGYIYAISVADGGKTYSATAVPAVYGKTGKLSFTLRPDAAGTPRMTSKDAGRPAKN